MSDKVYKRVQNAAELFCEKYGLPPAHLRMSSATGHQLSLEVLHGETTPGPDWPTAYLGMIIEEMPGTPAFNAPAHRYFELERGEEHIAEAWDVVLQEQITGWSQAAAAAMGEANASRITAAVASPGGIPKPKDSGVRQHFDTGSQRDTRAGKGRFDLLPTRAMRLLAQHFENGAEKYQARNWEKGQPLSRYMDSGLRHAFAHLEGKRDEPHLIAAVWNFMCCIDTEARVNEGLLPKELSDLPEPITISDKVSG